MNICFVCNARGYSKWLLAMLFVMVCGAVNAAGQGSANYRLKQDVLAGGGGKSSSVNYTLVAVVGQSSALGASSSAAYNLQAGFLSVPDTDGDGLRDLADNCTMASNADQFDADGDGYGNLCDGDLNNDNIVNFGDYGIFRQRLGSTDPVADFNHDGIVNLGDYGIFRQLLGKAPGPSGITP